MSEDEGKNEEKRNPYLIPEARIALSGIHLDFHLINELMSGKTLVSKNPPRLLRMSRPLQEGAKYDLDQV
jgi:hypothetical protein